MMKGEQTPGSMLEVYMHALASRTADDFLDQVNLGIGNYSEAEYWQQVEAFRKGLYADSAMTQKLIEKGKREALREVVDAVFEERDRAILDNIRNLPEPDDGQTRRGYYEEHADDIWRNLGDHEEYTAAEHKAWLVHETTGISRDWTPPHWRMLKMRHEASRSKNARLIDNLFGRPPEPSGGDMQMVDDFQ
jgi:hypothetical protein